MHYKVQSICVLFNARVHIDFQLSLLKVTFNCRDRGKRQNVGSLQKN